MASKLILSCLITIITAIYSWTNGALAQSSSSCANELMGLSPCLNYVTGNASTPSSSCCTQLAGVVKTQPRCLCLLLNGGTSSVGITINQTRALELPDVCKVETPSVSRCNSANGQTPSGTSSPVDSSNPNNSPNTPPITDTPAGGGSKTVPSTVDSSSGGDKKSSIFKLVGFLLLVASYSLSAPAEILSRGTRRSKVMAARGFEMCLGLALVLMMWHGAQAQSGCTNALLSLSPCLNYVTGNTSTPSQSCCSQLDGVVKSTPQCLCSMMNGAGISMGISINQTLALRLPGALPFISQLLVMDQQVLQHFLQKLSLHLLPVLQTMALMNLPVLPQHKVQPFPQVLNKT